MRVFSVGDLQPWQVAYALRDQPGLVFLHGGAAQTPASDWSFVACCPSQVLRGRANALGRDFLYQLDSLAHGESNISGPIPRVIGFLGYEMAGLLEALPAVPDNDLIGDDSWFGVYDAIWRYDHRRQQGCVLARSHASGERLCHLIRQERATSAPGSEPTFGEWRPDMRRLDYRNNFERLHRYIVNGDVYQVNLARRMRAPKLLEGNALFQFERLVQNTPSLYGAFLNAGDYQVLSNSPELFLHQQEHSDQVLTSPIKGTRRRGRSPNEDGALRNELATDPKEAAEHLMIVDLVRNDLGRVAKTGSVRVEDYKRVMRLPTVHHLVSDVRATILPNKSRADVLRACFPGGSITGAPKVRAMEIIAELEPARRGPYTGALGFLGLNGGMTFSIAIRTAVRTKTELALHVGGGIVFDSNPEREWAETEEKAAAFRTLLDQQPPFVSNHL